MRKFDDREETGRPRRRGAIGMGVLGTALILGAATMGAHALSRKDAPVKPASGAAQAMALASSKTPAP